MWGKARDYCHEAAVGRGPRRRPARRKAPAVHHHGHRHSHGLDHEAHAADDGHDHGRDGWHVHISLFGFEFVLWEPGAKEAEIAETEQDRTKKRKDRSAATGTTVVLLAESPLTAGWVSLFFIDPAPIPAKVGVVDAGANRVVPASAEPLFDFLVAPPPVPPPEIAAFRGVRRF